MTTPRRFLPSIASLRALEALERLGSATAAADELNQTQSAISRQLRTLEDQLGKSIFIRKSRRLTLTPEAKIYVEEVRQALTQIAQASMKLSLNPTGGTINLAILPTFGMRWLVPRLADFARQHPDVTINLSTRIERFSFASEPFDAALQFGDRTQPGTERLRLKPEAVIAVAAPDLLDGFTLSHPRDVQALPLLHIASRPDAWADWFDMHDAVLDQTTGTVHDQFSTILQATLHGLGVALLPDYLVEQDLASGRLIPVWGGPVESRGAYHLVWPIETSSDPALIKFRTWLAGQAESEEDTLPR